jgi:hypothetical protein
VLDRWDARGPAVGIGSALAVAAGLAVAVRQARLDRLPQDRDDELAIVYSGASLGVAVVMLPAARALRTEAAPPALTAAAVALGPLLVLAAVAVALSAPPRVSHRRVVVALGIALLVGAAMLGFELGGVRPTLGFGWSVAALSWAVAVPVLACALLTARAPSLRTYYVALAPALAVLAPLLCFGIVFASALGQVFLYALTGDQGFVDAIPAALSGLLLGVVLSALTLAPRLVRT